MIFCKFLDDYSISNCGKVRNDRTNRLRTPQQRSKTSGHLSVNIRGKNYSISRLVALYFVNNHDTENYKIVRHLDGNDTNNDYRNLAWGDQALNSQDAILLFLKRS